MDFLDKKIIEYSECFTSKESKILKKIRQETYLKCINPRMLSGHLQGQFLTFLSLLKKPENALEIGTFTGYSTICIAKGLKEKGKLITIDKNEELFERVANYFKEAGISNKIIQITGDATQIIPSLKGNFDFVFIDADKENYPLYFDLISDRITQGGIIIADNVLWSGKVLLDKDKQDNETKALVKYCNKVNSDKRFTNILLPIRDGLMLSYKKQLSS